MKSKSLSIMFANPRFAVMLIAAIALVIYSNTYKVPFVFDGGVQIENKRKDQGTGKFSFHSNLLSILPVPLWIFRLRSITDWEKLTPSGTTW